MDFSIENTIEEQYPYLLTIDYKLKKMDSGNLIFTSSYEEKEVKVKVEMDSLSEVELDFDKKLSLKDIIVDDYFTLTVGGFNIFEDQEWILNLELIEIEDIDSLTAHPIIVEALQEQQKNILYGLDEEPIGCIINGDINMSELYGLIKVIQASEGKPPIEEGVLEKSLMDFRENYENLGIEYAKILKI